MNKNILLTLSYDGSDFNGWQRQKTGERTVQSETEAALEKLLRCPVTLYGSGRTDSGVHAIEQAANFYSPLISMPEKNYVRALNDLLPPDIRVKDAREVALNFNARKNATSRTYRYYISNKENEDFLLRRYTWALHQKFDLDFLNSLTSPLIGEHDFSSFCSSGDENKSKCRFVESAEFFYSDFPFSSSRVLVFEVKASSFLYNMIRILVGTLCFAASKNLCSTFIRDLLLQKDRKKAFVTAPARGLFLYKVSFDGVRPHF